MSENEVYDGTVLDVYSGDDLIIMLDLRVEGLHKKIRIRLSGVDTPNAMGATSESIAGKLRKEVRQLCFRRPVRVTVINKQSTKWIAVVEVLREGGELFNINDDLIKQGYEFKREKTE